jgi:hypothetical protein
LPYQDKDQVDPSIFPEVMALGLRKIAWIIRFPDFFLFSYRYLFDICFIALPTKIQTKFKFGFYPLEFHEVMAHGLRKILQIVRVFFFF